jgi:hypothetical protein
MKHLILSLAFVLVCCSLVLGQSAKVRKNLLPKQKDSADRQMILPTTVQTKIRLGFIKNMESGCGCAFGRNQSDMDKDRYIYSDMLTDGSPYINVNGKNLKLTPVASSKLAKKLRVGNHSWETYTAGELKIRLDKTVTWVCPPKDEGCETTVYKVVLTISGKGQTVTEHLIGSCGC